MVTSCHEPRIRLVVVGATAPEENAPWSATNVPARADWAAVGVRVPVVRLRPQTTNVWFPVAAVADLSDAGQAAPGVVVVGSTTTSSTWKECAVMPSPGGVAVARRSLPFLSTLLERLKLSNLLTFTGQDFVTSEVPAALRAVIVNKPLAPGLMSSRLAALLR